MHLYASSWLDVIPTTISEAQNGIIERTSQKELETNQGQMGFARQNKHEHQALENTLGISGQAGNMALPPSD